MTREEDPYRGKWLSGEKEIDHMVEHHRGKGHRIVFTNGCFDILHVGHIRCLRHARSLGDVLVVAVNDDASVRAHKGEHRPVVPWEERMEVLSALESVDYLICLDSPREDRLLSLIQPHIHAKGRDYGEDTLPCRDLVLSYGGEIAFVGDPKDHSSTELIQRIQDVDFTS